VDYRVWGCLAHVRAPGANNLSACTCACVFLGFPLDTSGWVFYDSVTHQFFASQGVTFNESSSPPQRPVPVVSGGVGGAVAEGEGTRAAGACHASSRGAGGVRVETTPEEDTALTTQQPRPASPPGFPSVPQFASAAGRCGAWGFAATAAAAAVSVRASRESRGGVTAAAAAAAASVSVGALGESRGGVTAAATAAASVSPSLVTTVAGFASSHRLDYAAHLVSGPARSPSFGGAPVFPLEVLEDRQFELGLLAVAVPHLCTMLLAPEGDLDALDIPIPRTHAEAVSGPWALYWIAAEEAEMASYRSTGTYVDAVPPRGANVVSGMWLYKVKRPPGAPPVFKARYVARGFSQREGVDFFQTFAPTPKMTTLWVLLHIAA
ncbi:unnamed protein product, partial [Closterium sp. NIES-54]